MQRFWNVVTRRLAPVLGAGMLLQANGCSLDAATAQGLFGTIANRLLTDIVFGAFNLPTASMGF